MASLYVPQQPVLMVGDAHFTLRLWSHKDPDSIGVPGTPQSSWPLEEFIVNTLWRFLEEFTYLRVIVSGSL